MMPGHGAVVLGCTLNALVCLVQVAELAAGDFLQAHFLGGAPHPDMEGAATLQRPGGVLLPAVLPKLVCEIAGTEGTRSADCYHWSAMTYGRHWRHRVAVILGRGRVTCLRRSADKGFGGSDVFTAEVAPDSL